MAKKKQKEQKERQSLTEMQKSLEAVSDPSLKATLTRVMDRLKESRVENEAEEFKKEILKRPPKEKQLILSFLPHQMAKTSIFFPMSDRELKEERRKIARIEQETGWGKVVIEGIKLAIFEEDIFLALIKIAKDKVKKIGEDYLLQTNMGEIIHLLYGRQGYTKKSVERIEKTLQHFQLVRFELTTFDWKKKGKERLKTRTTRSIGNMVASYKYNKKAKDLTIKFNGEFFAYFLSSMLTHINFTLRRQLKKDGSKALLRFLATHNNPDSMHILTVLNAINFNVNQPMYRLRSRLKEFIRELKKQKILGSKTRLDKRDIVHFDIIPFGTREALPD